MNRVKNSFGWAILLALMLLVPFISACVEWELGGEEMLPPPAEQKFSLAIADNSLGDKSGAPLLTLKFEEGTPDATTIVAKRGSPTIDGRDGDAAWGPASELSLVSINAGGGPAEAVVKAAYDDDNIYFLVKWEDPTRTESIHREMWVYDAAAGGWVRTPQSEDRVYLLFNINATDFDSGCFVYCHVGDPAWSIIDTRMGTNIIGETVDIWHWKAARTNPTGYAEDKHWIALGISTEIAYEGVVMARTRLADAGYGFASENIGLGLPKYMHGDDPGANADFLFAGSADTVDFDPDASWSDGDTISGYIVMEGSGSIADVIAMATYTDGVWVVEFQRGRTTSYGDDVQFE